MTPLAIKNIRKSFGPTQVLKGITIDVQPGELLVLVGPSGCGKSTLLNLIAGLETITSGEIYIGNRLVNRVSPKDRDIAMVFQSYALYPNMNVRKNISFGLETRKIPRQQIETTVKRVADMLQIEDLLNRKPSQLSGGQRQRVAMGRALARNPAVFLFDEPLSNLDAKLRVEMRTEIKLLHQRIGATIIYVTHDQIEAMTLADRIAIMQNGRVQQLDTPHRIYENPVNMFVGGFIGSPAMNFLPCRVVKDAGHVGIMLEPEGQSSVMMPIPQLNEDLKAWLGKEIVLGLRPEHISTGFTYQDSGNQFQSIACVVDVNEPTGPDTLMFTRINGVKVTSRIHPNEARAPGETIRLMVDMSRGIFFDPQSEARIDL